jgi:hypothetical protein
MFTSFSSDIGQIICVNLAGILYMLLYWTELLIILNFLKTTCSR